MSGSCLSALLGLRAALCLRSRGRMGKGVDQGYYSVGSTSTSTLTNHRAGLWFLTRLQGWLVPAVIMEIRAGWAALDSIRTGVIRIRMVDSGEV